MNHSTEIQLIQCEERLRLAMLQSDISALDQLLSPDLVFTNHLGGLMSKQDDLQMHKTGIIKISEATLTDQKINILGEVAIVTAHACITGSFAGVESQNNFRFTRVWNKTGNNTWQVIAGHASIVT